MVTTALVICHWHHSLATVSRSGLGSPGHSVSRVLCAQSPSTCPVSDSLDRKKLEDRTTEKSLSCVKSSGRAFRSHFIYTCSETEGHE